MSDSTVLIEIETNGISRITLDRAELHNAFDDKMIHEITESIIQLGKDSRVKLIVLDAKGKSFSAGADLNWMRRMAGYDWDQNYKDSLKLGRLMQAIHDCNKTTVAIVQGPAFGGGVGLIACCDIALASTQAIFCLSEVKLGLIPAVISPYVVKAIGERNAKRYFVTAEKFNAEQAERMQLIHEVFEHDKLAEKSTLFLSKILKNGPEAMQKAKALVGLVHGQPIDQEIIEETARRIADTRASEEGREGVSAFLEKRSPQWLDNKIKTK